MSFVVESSALVVPDPYWNCGSATTRSKSIKTPHSRDHVEQFRRSFFKSFWLLSQLAPPLERTSPPSCVPSWFTPGVCSSLQLGDTNCHSDPLFRFLIVLCLGMSSCPTPSFSSVEGSHRFYHLHRQQQSPLQIASKIANQIGQTWTGAI